MQDQAGPDTAALIVAAGRGARAGGDVAKQWREIAGARVIEHTLLAFQAHPLIGRVVLVLNAADLDETFEHVETVAGGATRALSVRCGLEALATHPPARVLIHDVARPCVEPEVIDRVCKALETVQAAAPAVPVTDALWTGVDGLVAGTRDRSGLFRAQTPQGFAFEAILAAHRAGAEDAADDVAVARQAGLDVRIVEGSEDNIKITYPPDFDRAARILERMHGHQARQRI